MAWRAITNSILNAGQATFGDLVTYKPSVGSPFSVRGIFQSGYLEVDPRLERDTMQAPLASLQPRIDFRRSDLPAEPAEDDIVEIDGVNYSITSKQYDGWAMIRCYLAEA